MGNRLWEKPIMDFHFLLFNNLKIYTKKKAKPAHQINVLSSNMNLGFIFIFFQIG